MGVREPIKYQHKLKIMSAELANLNNCAVPILSRATVNLCWYYNRIDQRTLVELVTLAYEGVILSTLKHFPSSVKVLTHDS